MKYTNNNNIPKENIHRSLHLQLIARVFATQYKAVRWLFECMHDKFTHDKFTHDK